VPKGPSAEEKFCTEVVVMIKDCFQAMVREWDVKRNEYYVHWLGSLKRS
jgi:hypothetical protein